LEEFVAKSTRALSLLDFDRIIIFAKKLQDNWGNQVNTHVRISEIGTGIPLEVGAARLWINKYGSFDQLSYVLMFMVDNFMITGDFRQGKLNIKGKDEGIVQTIENLWDETLKTVNPSYDLEKVALPQEATRFVFSCLDESGMLKSDEEIFPTDEAYYLQYLKETRLNHILDRFGYFLASNQNLDGGWGVLPKVPSQIMPTAVSTILLTATGNLDNISSAVKYLFSRRSENGLWHENSLSDSMVTAIVLLALHKSEVKNETLEHAKSYIMDRISANSLGIENDAIILDALNAMGVRVDDLIKDPERYVPMFANISEKDSVFKVASALIILRNLGKEQSDVQVQKLLRLLLKLRNKDGGWPYAPNAKSSIKETIAAIVVLNRYGLM
jgi:hypothetical protein